MYSCRFRVSLHAFLSSLATFGNQRRDGADSSEFFRLADLGPDRPSETQHCTCCYSIENYFSIIYTDIVALQVKLKDWQYDQGAEYIVENHDEIHIRSKVTKLSFLVLFFFLLIYFVSLDFPDYQRSAKGSGESRVRRSLGQGLNDIVEESSWRKRKLSSRGSRCRLGRSIGRFTKFIGLFGRGAQHSDRDYSEEAFQGQ